MKPAPFARRGATRTRPVARPSRGFGAGLRKALAAVWRFCQLLVAGVVTAAALFALYTGFTVVWPVIDRPVEHVVIEGDFRQIDPELLHDLVAKSLDTTLLRLDLEQLRGQLVREPWVSEAQVRRQWPDRLWIRIAEDRPIARWGASGFVNQRGELIAAPLRAEVGPLPLLEGEVGTSEEVTRQYLLLNRALMGAGLRIARLHRSAHGEWEMQMENGIEIVLGRNDLLGKTRRLIAAWHSMAAEELERVARIDARYDNGVAVRWKPDQEALAKAPPGGAGGRS